MKKKKLKLTISMIIKRGHYLYFFYYWIYGLIQDYHISGKNMNETIFNVQDNAYPVQCISYPYLKKLVKEIEWTEKDVFVDVGCAWGRLLGYMDRYTVIKKMYGVELNSEAADFASEIFEESTKVKIIKGNILDNIPHDGNIFFLFNPFSSEILDAFLTKIEEEFEDGSKVRLLYLYPMCKHIFDKHKEKWVLVEEKSIKPRYLGGLQICIYEFEK